MRLRLLAQVAALAAGILAQSSTLQAQRISAGVVLGRSLTDGFEDQTYYDFGRPLGFPIGTRFWSPSKDWVAGGLLEVHFNPHWSVEASGLFRQLSGRWAAVMPDGSLNSVSPHPVVTWQFPVLLKYRFEGRRLNPFVEAGPSFRTAGNLNTSDPSHHGIAAGAGVEIPWRNLRLAPSVRYTLWSDDPYRGPNARTAPDQVEILVRLSHQSQSHERPLGRHVSLGAMLGTNLTDDLYTLVHRNDWPPGSHITLIASSARSLIAGPSLEVRLPYRLAVEANALYRPLSRASTVVHADGSREEGGTFRFITWEFPVLAKYRLPSLGGLHPFLAAGPSFRLPQLLVGASRHSATAGVGLEFRIGPMTVAPAIRYTRWAPDRPGPGSAEVCRNQSQVLVGVSF